jgi:hypothetical protein
MPDVDHHATIGSAGAVGNLVGSRNLRCPTTGIEVNEQAVIDGACAHRREGLDHDVEWHIGSRTWRPRVSAP